jgi:hypothetical protein
MRNRPIPAPGGSGPIVPTMAGMAPTLADIVSATAAMAPSMAGMARCGDFGRAGARPCLGAGASGTPR